MTTLTLIEKARLGRLAALAALEARAAGFLGPDPAETFRSRRAA